MFDPYLHIDKYMAGTLAAEEVSLFNKALLNDAELQSVVDNYDEAKRLSEGLIEIEVRGVLDSIATDEDDFIEDGREKSSLKLNYLWPVIAIAAMIAGLIFLSNIFSTPVKAGDLYASHFKVPVMAITTKGNQADSLVNLAQGLFNAQAYEESIKVFSKIDRSKETDLYRAINFQVLNQSDSTLYILNSINTQSSDSYWYAAMAYLSLGDMVKAKESLLKIDKESVHFKNSLQIIDQL